MTQVGDDCYYFYNSTCTKGASCPFRHVEEAKLSKTVCSEWKLGKCFTLGCPYRHEEIQPRGSIPCYWEKQPGGCTKPHCQFLHSKPKENTAVPPFTGASQEGPQGVPLHRPPFPQTSVGESLLPGIPPPHIRPHIHRPPFTRGQMIPPRGMPFDVTRMRHPPPGWIPPPHQQWPPPPMSVPMSTSIGMPVHVPFGLVQPVVPPVQPVIVNLNSEDSDQDSRSPMKSAPGSQVGDRVVVEPAKADILDYFLLPNRKTLVRPRSPERDRSLSPERPPHRRRSSLSPSPVGRDRGSASPERGSRRSISSERYSRRRSHSLDRSRSHSPDWRDSHRRRSRSRSMSPDRRHYGPRGRLGGRLGVRGRPDKPRDLRDKLGAKDKEEKEKLPQLEELKVPQGPKIVSLKKPTKDSMEGKEEATDTLNPDGTVKSLEEIYRERALQSLMSAKRQKVLEMKAARWAGKTSQNSSESKSESADDKKADGSSSSSEEEVEKVAEEKEEKDQSDVDLDADVDIELDAGEIDLLGSEVSETTENNSSAAKNQDPNEDLEEQRRRRVIVETDEKPGAKGKPSVKSRLGLKGRLGVSGSSAEPAKRLPDTTEIKRTIKQRLGEAVASNDNPEKGAVRLNRGSVKDRLGFGKERVLSGVSSQIRVVDNDVQKRVVLPRITIQQDVRSPLDDEADSDDSGTLRDSRSRRVRNRSGENEDLSEEEDLLEEEDEERHRSKSRKKSRKEMTEKELEKYLIEKVKRKLKKKMKRKEEKQLRALKRKKRALEDKLSEQDVSDEELLKEENSDQENRSTNSTSRQTTQDSHGSRSGSDVDEADKLSGRRVKSSEDVTSEKVEGHSHTSDDSRDSLGNTATGMKRKMLVEEDENEVKEPEVRITFKGEDCKRKLLRLNRNQEEEKDASEKPDKDSTASQRSRPSKAKRAWEVYVPPAMKKAGAVSRAPPVDQETLDMLQKIKKQGQREMIDYSDMFSSKKTSQPLPAVSMKPSVSAPVRQTVSDTSISTSSSSPKRVEMSKSSTAQNVGVKSFAEIMAEKKKKRLQKYKPIMFDDSQDSTDSSLAPTTGNVSSRLLPVEDSNSTAVGRRGSSNSYEQSSVSSESTDTIPGSEAVPKGRSSPDKLSRWKKRKSLDTGEVKTVTSRLKPLSSLSSETATEVRASKPDLHVRRSLSSEKAETKSSPMEEKKKKTSASLLDFDDDLLDMSDDDIDLDLKDDKDHDELMREMDELLA